MVLPVRRSASIAGSRDCTTTLPAPSNATAIGWPTICGTDGSGTPQVTGGSVRRRAARSGHRVRRRRAAGARGAGAAADRPSRDGMPPTKPALQGPCMPSGMQPIVVVGDAVGVGDEHARQVGLACRPEPCWWRCRPTRTRPACASGEIAMSTASTMPAIAGPLCVLPSEDDHRDGGMDDAVARVRTAVAADDRLNLLVDAALVQHHHAAAVGHLAPSSRRRRACRAGRRARSSARNAGGAHGARDRAVGLDGQHLARCRKRLTRRRGPSTTTSRRSRDSVHACGRRCRRRPAG